MPNKLCGYSPLKEVERNSPLHTYELNNSFQNKGVKDSNCTMEKPSKSHLDPIVKANVIRVKSC